MSLDVTLFQTSDAAVKGKGSGIFIRENGGTREITKKEWNEKFPDREPVVFNSDDIETGEVFSANITHNLNKMADAAGIYKHLWRPEELRINHANELIAPLTEGLAKMKSDPEHFKTFNASNGWGTYDQFIPWVEKYLTACIEYPYAEIRVSR